VTLGPCNGSTFLEMMQTPHMKPNIFIGSSKEALPLAKIIQQEMAKDFNTTIWKDCLFQLGQSTLDSLLVFVQCFDFAILLLTDDDLTTSRRKTTSTPRDNVILELGLFMGALGRRRTFVVLSNRSVKGKPVAEIKMPSDLFGLTEVRLPNLTMATIKRRVGVDLKQLVGTIRERSAQSTLQLLPSTGLAIGYFNNFVLPVCQGLNTLRTVKLGGKDVKIKPDSFDFTVVLPKDLSQSSIFGAKKYVDSKGLLDFTLPTSGRPYPFYVGSKLQKGRVQFYDYPTTLNASQGAIRLALSGPFLGFSQHHELLEKMEIANFQRAMESLLREPSAAQFADNVKFIQAT